MLQQHSRAAHDQHFSKKVDPDFCADFSGGGGFNPQNPPLATGLVNTTILRLLGRRFCYTADVFLGSHIFKDPRPIAAKLCHMIGIWLRRSRKFQKFGGFSPKNIGGQKHAKFRSIFGNIRLWLRISPERLKISNSKGDVFYTDSYCVLGNRSRELWSINLRDFDVRLDPLKCTFWDTISRHSGVLRAEIFTRARDWPRLPSAHQNWDGGPPKKFNREN